MQANCGEQTQILYKQQFTTFIHLCKASFVTYVTSFIYVQQFKIHYC